MIANPLIFTNAGAKVKTRLIGPENLVREETSQDELPFIVLHDGGVVQSAAQNVPLDIGSKEDIIAGGGSSVEAH
jgi:hypothetical protein